MTPASLLKQFDVIAEAPGGVQRLRELILQLAVRGKLVSQELEYNPGAAGSLPVGWAPTTLGALGEISPRNNVGDDTAVGFCPMALLPERHGEHARFDERPWRAVKKGYTHFADGDVVVAKITPCFQNGKAAVMRGLPNGVGAGTTELHVLRPDTTRVLSDYVLVFLRSPEFITGGVATMTGTAGQQRVSRDYFASAPFALPPLTEQRRIVAKVDELMALCNELETSQQRRAEARRLANRAVLQQLTTAADDAELTAAWGRVNDSFDWLYVEPGAVAELRRTVVGLAVRGRLVAQASTVGPATVEPPSPAGLGQSPYKVPKGWVWRSFGDVTTAIEAGWSPSCEARPREGDEWGVLKVSAVSWGTYDPDENKALPSKLAPRPEHEVRAGDFLMSRANTAELVGRSVLVVSTPPRLLLSDKTLRVRIADAVDPRYLNLFNNSPSARAYYSSLASGTSSSMRNLSREQIRALPVAVPPLAEQRQILMRVDELMFLCDRLEEGLAHARDRASHLAAAVLHRLVAA